MNEPTPAETNAQGVPPKPAPAASTSSPPDTKRKQANAASGQLRGGAAQTQTADGLIDFHIGPENAKHVMEMLLREMAASGEAGAASRAKATDLHLNVDRAPDYRIERVIRSVMSKPLTERDVALLSDAMMSDHQRERFTTNHCVDLSYHLGTDRFRVNIVECFNGRSVSIRRFEQIKDFSQYHLPEQYLRIAEGHRGFVIMSGSTGSGKTTSIAAMLDHVNRSFHRKIVTIEDPIEYVYVPKKSIIVQMEIGDDGIPTEDIALRNLVRMDPDVGLAGEMRDRDSLEAALKTAQAGHLIFGTLHCEGVGQAFDRVLAYYDKGDQQRILGTLADNLGAIINQRLLPSIHPGVDVVPAYEIFIPNSLTRRYIREMRYADAIAEMDKEAMKQIGCVTYVDSLYKLVMDEWVDFQLALEHAGEHAERLTSRVKGIAVR